MMRIGVTPYLNARPLAAGLAGRTGIELAFASPARLADMLRCGALDAALTSSSEYFNGNYAIIPGCAISSCGGADALLFSNLQLEHLRQIALDAASRSTNLLLRLALHWLRPGAAINYHMRPADTCRSLKELDACLVVGDPALSACHESRFRYDLAEYWHQMTGLPMVLTLWLAPVGGDPRLAEIVQEACAWACEQRDTVIARATEELGWDEDFIRRYLNESLDYSWTTAHAASLLKFGEALFELGLVTYRRDLQYLSEPIAAGNSGRG
ncbi:hypothetical protein JW859_09805 [bacterium]|nr:hypothetical protein [bacterium]